MSQVEAEDGADSLLHSCSAAEIVTESGSEAADAAGGPHSKSSAPDAPKSGSKQENGSDGKHRHVPSLLLRQPSVGSGNIPANAAGVPQMLPAIQEDEEEDAKQPFGDAHHAVADFPVPPPICSVKPEDGEAVLVAVRDFATYLHRELVQLHARLDSASRHVGEVCAELRLEMASLQRHEAKARNELATSLGEELDRLRVTLRKEIIDSMNFRGSALPAYGAAPARSEERANSIPRARSAALEGPAAGTASPPLRLQSAEAAKLVHSIGTNARRREDWLNLAKLRGEEESRDDEKEAGAVAAADALTRVRKLLRSTSEGHAHVAKASQRLEPSQRLELERLAAAVPGAALTPRLRRKSATLPVAAPKAEAAPVDAARTLPAAGPTSSGPGSGSPRSFRRPLLVRPFSPGKSNGGPTCEAAGLKATVVCAKQL
mmetsp:Transcript_71544/g.141874  ORF Transcript_71544/g.141874 Transcript_71544/m.141874 type:complete len:432 (-) Transcript_71544:70-1365(-)